MAAPAATSAWAAPPSRRATAIHPVRVFELTVNTSLYAKPPYDPDKDFIPVTMAATHPMAGSSIPTIPSKSIKELVELLKANPGKYTFASPGIGTTPHLSSELFRHTFGLDFSLCRSLAAARRSSRCCRTHADRMRRAGDPVLSRPASCGRLA